MGSKTLRKPLSVDREVLWRAADWSQPLNILLALADSTSADWERKTREMNESNVVLIDLLKEEYSGRKSACNSGWASM